MPLPPLVRDARRRRSGTLANCMLRHIINIVGGNVHKRRALFGPPRRLPIFAMESTLPAVVFAKSTAAEPAFLAEGTAMPDTPIRPYLFFGGRCQEALDFYRMALGAEVEMVLLHKDSPEPPPPGMLQPGFEEKVMHSAFRIAGNTLMASDGCGEGASFSGFSLSLSVPTQAEAERAFAALADGGEVRMPLNKTFWSPCFGMLTDRFGVGWMINVPGDGEP